MMTVAKNRNGNGNGKKMPAWLGPFIAFVAMSLPIVSGIIWINVEIRSLRAQQERYIEDMLSASCFIAAMDELRKNNPNMKWLDSTEIRQLQRNNPPYGRSGP